MPNTAKILLVEDEESLGQTLQECLQMQGYKCLWASNAFHAQKFIWPRII